MIFYNVEPILADLNEPFFQWLIWFGSFSSGHYKMFAIVLQYDSVSPWSLVQE